LTSQKVGLEELVNLNTRTSRAGAPFAAADPKTSGLLLITKPDSERCVGKAVISSFKIIFICSIRTSYNEVKAFQSFTPAQLFDWSYDVCLDRTYV